MADEYEVVFSDIADACLADLSKPDRKKVLDLGTRMQQHPFAGAARLKYMGTAEVWRKKVGRVRVLYTADKVKLLVVIRLVDLRDDDTYDRRRLDDSLDWVPQKNKDNQEQQEESTNSLPFPET